MLALTYLLMSRFIGGVLIYLGCCFLFIAFIWYRNEKAERKRNKRLRKLCKVVELDAWQKEFHEGFSPIDLLQNEHLN